MSDSALQSLVRTVFRFRNAKLNIHPLNSRVSRKNPKAALSHDDLKTKNFGTAHVHTVDVSKTL